MTYCQYDKNSFIAKIQVQQVNEVSRVHLGFQEQLDSPAHLVILGFRDHKDLWVHRDKEVKYLTPAINRNFT